MNKFEIVTDNTADLYDGFYEENPITRLCFPFTIGGKEYVNDDEYPILDYYQELKMGHMIKTSQINQYTASKAFEEVLNRGNDLLYISFSSGMSGSYDNISAITAELKTKYPDRKIFVIDSLSGGGGEGLLVYRAWQLQKKGKSIEEVVAWLEENRTSVHHTFIVNDLANIKHSGRISTLQALLGAIVNLKPVLEITDKGKVGVVAKAMGRKKAIQEMSKAFRENYIDDKNDFIMIGHTGLLDEAKEFGTKIAELAPNKEIRYCLINKLVAGNSGYSALVVYYFGKKRKSTAENGEN